jgi:uncharacterized protein YbjT (DUF2867 family)
VNTVRPDGASASGGATVARVHVVIAGGHGQIALRLTALLAGRGDVVTGVVRNPDHRADVEGAGGRVAVLDLEAAGADDLAEHLRGADAVVFAAGAGPGSGVARKDTVDRAAAVLLADAAAAAGVRRYLLVSSMGVDDVGPDADPDDVWTAYLRAKKAAEDAVRATELAWTVLRPGRLTDDPAAGTVLLGPSVPPGAVTRDDTAAVLAALLDAPGTAGQVLELVEGDTDVLAAVAAAAAVGGAREGDEEPEPGDPTDATTVAPADTAASATSEEGSA